MAYGEQTKIDIIPSPRWLARKDRWEDCHKVLVNVHGKGDPNAPFVAHELQDIRDMCEFERHNADVTYWELFYPKLVSNVLDEHGRDPCSAMELCCSVPPIRDRSDALIPISIANLMLRPPECLGEA